MMIRTKVADTGRHRIEFTTKNWNPKGHYEFGLGVGFYFSGFRNVTRKGEIVTIPTKHEKQIDIFKNTMRMFSEVAMKECGGIPMLIIDDCSPFTLDDEQIMELTGDNPTAIARLPFNMGCGGKESILQRVLKERCEYVCRWDADLTFDKFSFHGIKESFSKLEDAWAITPCITYFARLDASQMPDHVRYFSGSNIADFCATPAHIFDEIGYSDWRARSNEDGDIRLRALACLGLKCYVDRQLTGKSPPSGGGGDLAQRMESAKYVEMTRPFIKVVYPKKGTPRLMLNKKRVELAKGFYVAPHPLGITLAQEIWSE